jgi:enoyl-CoA hydratase
MSDDAVLTRREGAVGVMTFNRPEQLNTLNMPMMLALESALGELECDAQVRVIVITGADDRAFMAGGDINDLAQRRPTGWYDEFGKTVHRVFRRFEACDKPTLAAVNGWALGGGMELMLCTDLRLLAAEARIGLPEIRLGLFPGGGGSQRLMRQIPLCHAKKLMFTGQHLEAAQALALGLVNEVLPRADLMPRAMALAGQVAAMSTQTLKLLKHAMLHGAEMPLEQALAYERAMLAIVLDHPDAKEGCQAFLDKRSPRFSDR